MSIRFAAPNSPGRTSLCSPAARPMIRRAVRNTANDNGCITGSEEMLREALRYFGQHGLGAARSARIEAEKAFFAGDRKAYDWWMGITRTLDRRLAANAEQFLPAKDIS